MTMVALTGMYDPNAEVRSFEQVPPGEYLAVLKQSEIEDVSTREHKGKCLKLHWQVQTGPYADQIVFQRLNMWAENMGPNTDKVVSIAQSQFAEIRQATGKIVVKDSTELHHIPCIIKVGPQKNNPEYMEIKAVKPANGGQPAQQQTGYRPPASNQQQRPAADASAPWRASA